MYNFTCNHGGNPSDRGDVMVDAELHKLRMTKHLKMLTQKRY